MKNVKTIIIGAGISGLILSWITKAQLIGKETGGQFNIKDWSLGPRFLHVKPETAKMLKRLGLSRKKKTIKVGYFDQKIIDKPDENFRQKYYEKTRKTKAGYTPSSMNSGVGDFKSYTLDFQDIINALSHRVRNRHIKENVLKIDLQNKTILLESGKQYKYETLISTIPRKVFTKLAGIEDIELKTLPKTFIKASRRQDYFPDVPYDFVYCADGWPWHRITFEKDYAIFEFVESEVPKMSGELDRYVMWDAQILPAEPLKVEGVIFVGRYAEWRHNFLVNDAIVAAEKLKAGGKQDG